MVIRDLYVFRFRAGPSKYDPPLIVDPNGVPASKISLQSLKPIARWRDKIAESEGIVDLHELAAGDLCDIRWEAFGNAALSKDQPGEFALEALDHAR
jgi:hypothetical protein